MIFLFTTLYGSLSPLLIFFFSVQKLKIHKFTFFLFYIFKFFRVDKFNWGFFYVRFALKFSSENVFISIRLGRFHVRLVRWLKRHWEVNWYNSQSLPNISRRRRKKSSLWALELAKIFFSHDSISVSFVWWLACLLSHKDSDLRWCVVFFHSQKNI